MIACMHSLHLDAKTPMLILKFHLNSCDGLNNNIRGHHDNLCQSLLVCVIWCV